MNKTRKLGWLALGIGGLVLAIASTQFWKKPQTVETKPKAEAKTEETETVESDTPSISPEFDAELDSSLKAVTGDGAPQPPSARNMPPIEINRDREDGRFKELGPPRFSAGDEAKNKGAPPPLELAEPQGINRGPGNPPAQKQAFSDFDSPPPSDGSDPGNYWEPPPVDPPMDPIEPPMVDDFGGGDAPPAPPADEGDFQPEPSNDPFDGGTGY